MRCSREVLLVNVLAPARRVLVRTPSWLGDFVACEPVLRALHELWSAHGVADRLTFAGPAPFLALLDGAFDGVHRVAVARGADPELRAWRGHDVALLLDGSWRSSWAAFRAGIPERVGWAGGARAPLLTLAPTPSLERGATPLGRGIHGRAPRRLPRPFGATCVELAALAGLTVRDRAPRFAAQADAKRRVAERLRAQGFDPSQPFILVNAGARAGSSKAADPEVLARVARALGLPVVIACAPGEEANARATRAALEFRDSCRPIPRVLLLDDPPASLAELVAAIDLSTVCTTADSGPRHVAQALGKRTIVLCGPTDPRHTAEHGARITVLWSAVDCGPCHREMCPRTGAEERLCMRSIDVSALEAEEDRVAVG